MQMRQRLLRTGARIFGAVTLACAALPATSSAAPSVKMKAKAVPIPRNLKRRHSRSWPHTGNILGHPAAVEAKISIEGSEYDGFPAPLRQVVVYLPKGTKIHAQGFKTCPVSRFANQEPERCPRLSLASPPGEARGTVRFGNNEPVHEKVLVQGYFAPHDGLTFWIEGRSAGSDRTLRNWPAATDEGSLRPAAHRLCAFDLDCDWRPVRFD